MSHRTARREVLQAIAEFERGCLAFSRGVARVRRPSDATLQRIIQELGEPRPAQRAATVRKSEQLKTRS